MTSSTPGIEAKSARSTTPMLPVMPMAVRWAPGIGWALRPCDSIFSTTPSTCSGAASIFITINMVELPGAGRARCAHPAGYDTSVPAKSRDLGVLLFGLAGLYSLLLAFLGLVQLLMQAPGSAAV